jgi:hypothetical protein
MVAVSSRTFCRQFFKELNILTLAPLYILEVTCFIRKYCQSLELNSNILKNIFHERIWISMFDGTKLKYATKV